LFLLGLVTFGGYVVEISGDRMNRGFKLTASVFNRLSQLSS